VLVAAAPAGVIVADAAAAWVSAAAWVFAADAWVFAAAAAGVIAAVGDWDEGEWLLEASEYCPKVA